MNELERAVHILLSQTPRGPELERVQRRARRRRIRNGATIVVVAALIATGTVGIAGAVGHRASSPRVAVAPTTSTTVNANAALHALADCYRFLDTQRVQLKAVEQQLNQQLSEELAAHSPNAAATDAAHQAVLRELSDVQQQILRLAVSRFDPGPVTCPPADEPPVPAESSETWCARSRFLDAQREQLKELEAQLNQQLTEELAVHSPNAGATDADHQAVLRTQSDVQQLILYLEEHRPGPGPFTCSSPDERTTSTTVSTP